MHLPTVLHTSAKARYGSWHAFAVALLRAQHDVSCLIGIPSGWHRWCTARPQPARSGRQASVVTAARPAPALKGAGAGGAGGGAGAGAAPAASTTSPEEWIWSRFPVALASLWAGRLACRGDEPQTNVDCCGDNGDLKWPGLSDIVLWRGLDAELDCAGLSHSREELPTVTCSDGLFSMIGIQDGLDWGVGWLGWFPQTEDTTMLASGQGTAPRTWQPTSSAPTPPRCLTWTFTKARTRCPRTLVSWIELGCVTVRIGKPGGSVCVSQPKVT